MSISWIWFLVSAHSTLSSFLASAEEPFKVVCYYTSWSSKRAAIAKFTIKDIDTTLCTHIIYSFALLDNVTYTMKMQIPEYDKDNYYDFTKLKSFDVKVLLAVGGWTDSQSSLKYSYLAGSESARKNFAHHAVKYLKQYGFDGLDIDWEYPGRKKEDKENYIALLKDLSEILRKEKLMLTAAVPSKPYVINAGFDIARIAEYVDQVHLMTYNFHTEGERFADHHSRLYPALTDRTPTLNTQYAVQIWIDRGMPASKIILGIPTYGRCWTLSNPQWNVPPAPAKGRGLPGNFSRSGGMLAYFEICDGILKNGWTETADSGSPYAFKGNQWVGYDNPTSIKEKVTFIKKMKLGGGMIWNLDFDDFTGTLCNAGKYPLLTTIRDNLK